MLLAVAVIVVPTSGGATVVPDPADLSVPLLEGEQPDVPAPRIGDHISPAELQDLTTLALQSGMTLDAAITRYAWNDNFALTVQMMDDAAPGSLTDAVIVDATVAWVQFADQAPPAALAVLAEFQRAHPQVAVEVRGGAGFDRDALGDAIEEVHAAVHEAPGVASTSTTFSWDDRTIRSVVVLDATEAPRALDDLNRVASSALDVVSDLGVRSSIETVVTLSDLPILGGEDSANFHYGGEDITGCTTAFGVKRISDGFRGVATAGHCGNDVSDDGSALTYRGGYQGNHGDFQWHNGPKAESDDFYSGDAVTLEVNRRDVAAVGAPVVGQSLCKNGKTNKKQCQQVRKVNVCKDQYCNLVQMGERQAAPGDSGGSVFWDYTAYGVHHGWHYDPSWPADRDLFSRADRIDNALSVNIATS